MRRRRALRGSVAAVEVCRSVDRRAGVERRTAQREQESMGLVTLVRDGSCRGGRIRKLPQTPRAFNNPCRATDAAYPSRGNSASCRQEARLRSASSVSHTAAVEAGGRRGYLERAHARLPGTRELPRLKAAAWGSQTHHQPLAPSAAPVRLPTSKPRSDASSSGAALPPSPPPNSRCCSSAAMRCLQGGEEQDGGAVLGTSGQGEATAAGCPRACP